MCPERAARDATETDFEPLVLLWRDGWRDGHADLVPAELARLRTLENFRERLRRMLPRVRVMGLPGAPLGFHFVKEDELNQFYVAAAARGSGLAQALLQDAERQMTHAGIGCAWLACAIGNARAARFYEKCGWSLAGVANVPTETSAGFFPLDVWRFEKRLMAE